jgi:hypothetical protein
MSLLKFFCLDMYLKLCLRSKLIYDFINMQIDDQSWMYWLSDVLAHFKGVSIFFKPMHNTLHVRKKRQYNVLVKYAATTI